jgi:uncharacterized HAD superfamily protein
MHTFEPSIPVGAVDADDVLWECMRMMFAFHNEHYGTAHEYEHLTTYALETLFGCGFEEKNRRVMEFYHSPHHDRIEPINGAVEAIKRLARSHHLHIVTSRPSSIRARTQRLIDRYFPDVFGQVHCSDHFVHGQPGLRVSKAKICAEIGAAWSIDDSFEYATDMARAGITVFMPDRPWNRGKLYPGVIRVYGWDEIITKIETPLALAQ